MGVGDFRKERKEEERSAKVPLLVFLLPASCPGKESSSNWFEEYRGCIERVWTHEWVGLGKGEGRERVEVESKLPSPPPRSFLCELGPQL